MTPLSEIVADPARGSMMGNRGGALHDATRTIGRRRWVSRQWICCVLAFKNRRREVMAPGRYTELFFLDEATAFAAGHRPCFECRRADANRFAKLWALARGDRLPPRAFEIDDVLHGERLDERGNQRRHRLTIDELPAGTMIIDPARGAPALVLETALRSWHIAGYGPALPRLRRGLVDTLTPPGIIAVMKSGYRPLLHETARDPGEQNQ